jgi:virulence factor Mce-like protein
VTLLVSCIAVVLAVQANQGLPFVPTYDVRAQLPGGANLVTGNEVRMGGFRVGTVERIEPAVVDQGGGRAIALIHMKLDKVVEPISVDSQLTVRPRSALGLKYIELSPGRSAKKVVPGQTLPLKQARQSLEIDDFFNTYSADLRQNLRQTLHGFGDAFAGRGQGINLAIRDLRPFVSHLQPVMRTLSDPETELDQLFVQAGRTAEQIAPVASTYAELFGNMATTFEALGRHPDRLRGAIERAAPTFDEGIRSFPVQRPFLQDTAVLARRLEPVADELMRSLPGIRSALRTGTPVLEKSPPFYRRTRNVFASLDRLTRNPDTLLGLRDLHRTLQVATPLVEWVSPFQTVCNYFGYWIGGLGEHVSEPVRGGTIQRINLMTGTAQQPRRYNTTEAEKPVDVSAGQDPTTAKTPDNQFVQALRTGAYPPAIDAQGNADCRTGQRGFIKGPLSPNNRYGPNEDGGRRVVQTGDFGVLHGGTYKSRELGIRNLRDVP